MHGEEVAWFMVTVTVLGHALHRMVMFLSYVNIPLLEASVNVGLGNCRHDHPVRTVRGKSS